MSVRLLLNNRPLGRINRLIQYIGAHDTPDIAADALSPGLAGRLCILLDIKSVLGHILTEDLRFQKAILQNLLVLLLEGDAGHAVLLAPPAVRDIQLPLAAIVTAPDAAPPRLGCGACGSKFMG